jgi:hypothetical protein
MTDTAEAAPKRTAMQVALDAERVAAANGRQLAELGTEVANISALAEAAAESGTGTGTGGVDGIKYALTEMAKDIGKVVGLIPGDLWASKGGALATQQQVAEVRKALDELHHDSTSFADAGSVDATLNELREQVGELIDWRAGFLGADGPKDVLSVAERARRAIAAVSAMDERLRGVEEWQASVRPYSDHLRDMRATIGELAAWRQAELEGAQDGGSTMMAGLVEMVAELREELEQLRGRLAHKADGGGTAVHSLGAPHVLGLIAQLQKLVYEISKGREFKAENGRGVVTQQYSFRGIDEAQNAIGSAQREIGLIGPKVTIVEKSVSVAEVNKGTYTQVWTTVSVTARYTFQSPVDGSEWSTEGCGMGRDMGDKAESKALAGAFKYALFHGLNIPVRGVFVDAETEDPRIEREREQDTGRTHGHGQAPPNDGDEPWGDAGHDGLTHERRAARALDNYTQAESSPDMQAVAQPAAKEDNRTADELARDALAAVRRAANANEAAGVWNWIYQKQMLMVRIDGVPVGQHMLAAIRLLPGGDQAELPGWGQFR